ncbi:hypothetical protein AAIP55_002393 [Flavobacterium psychrophilum]|nr:hypothetical protein [Flavobacterium psychrophilum]EKT3964533.1 hypothetical protein [Flavobacterium psychrophilum]EKT4510917.1 hypothetical protein [Flavobacterium psychrophilum]EKT4517924.1 hypothetical protein [Flavobacterium psychrophilum]
MGNSIYITSSTDNFSIENITENISIGDENLDSVRVLFEYLFTTEQSLKLQNKYLILFIHHYIQENKKEIINNFFLDNAIEDLDISLLKSALLITENLPELSESRLIVNSIFEKKINQ